MITKYLTAIVAILAFAAGVTFGAKVIAPKAPKIEIPRCPDCHCPPQANTIDFEKIKGFKGTINLNQHYSLEVNGDSLVLGRIQEALRKELDDFKVKKCK